MASEMRTIEVFPTLFGAHLIRASAFSLAALAPHIDILRSEAQKLLIAMKHMHVVPLTVKQHDRASVDHVAAALAVECTVECTPADPDFRAAVEWINPERRHRRGVTRSWHERLMQLKSRVGVMDGAALASLNRACEHAAALIDAQRRPRDGAACLAIP